MAQITKVVVLDEELTSIPEYIVEGVHTESSKACHIATSAMAVIEGIVNEKTVVAKKDLELYEFMRNTCISNMESALKNIGTSTDKYQVEENKGYFGDSQETLDEVGCKIATTESTLLCYSERVPSKYRIGILDLKVYVVCQHSSASTIHLDKLLKEFNEEMCYSAEDCSECIN